MFLNLGVSVVFICEAKGALHLQVLYNTQPYNAYALKSRKTEGIA
jgi:hypothetical protein